LTILVIDVAAARAIMMEIISGNGLKTVED
jgi:hypothetical protein